jgi:LysR family transcriptional regulator (chromosome initiation inhibitor)
MVYRAAATRAFQRRWFPDGLTRDAVAGAPVLFFNRQDELQTRFVQRVLGLRGVTLHPHWIPSSVGFVDAALADVGWGLHPDLLIQSLLASRRLVDLAPGKTLGVALHWQQWRLASPTLARLASAIRSRAQAALC